MVQTFSLDRVWAGRREYFRVDDVFPIIARKVKEDFPCKKSKILSGYGTMMPDVYVPDETVSPQLWKMLIDVNTKLGLILDRLYLESEGLLRAENKQVDISASGIRFTMEERVDIGEVVEVKMLLPTCPPLGILIYGDVVRVRDTGNGAYEVALHFLDIDDEVRDEIIQYTIKRQRNIIRRQKHD